MLQPVKAATPATAGRGVALVHASVAPPGGVIVNVTELVSLVTVLPPRSCTFTTGWVANATSLAAPLGWRVKASCAAGPTVMVVPALTAGVNDPAVAVSVYVPGRSMLHPANV